MQENLWNHFRSPTYAMAILNKYIQSWTATRFGVSHLYQILVPSVCRYLHSCVCLRSVPAGAVLVTSHRHIITGHRSFDQPFDDIWPCDHSAQITRDTGNWETQHSPSLSQYPHTGLWRIVDLWSSPPPEHQPPVSQTQPLEPGCLGVRGVT